MGKGLIEEQERFKERFEELEVPIKFTYNENYPGIIYDHYIVGALVSFGNIQEYLENSNKMGRVVRKEFSDISYKQRLRVRLRFGLDNLVIEKKGQMSLGCKKRSFLLSDESGRLLTSIRGQGQSAYGMSWAHAMYSKEGDKVKVNVGFPERKVDGGNLSSSSITKLTNYSFADHLTLEREIHILEGGDCGV